MTAVDYAGVYMIVNETNKILKLCDTMNIMRPSVSF